MSIMDISLQRMSLGALIIALGRMVDNSIVVADGIAVRLRQNMKRREAAIEAVGQNAFPLLIATIIAVLTFYSIVASRNSTGEYCKSLFTVMAISLLLSWGISVLTTPLQCIDFLSSPKGDQKEEFKSPLFVYGAESRLPVLENELRVAKNALAVLLGTTPDKVDSIVGKPGPIPKAPLTLAVGIPAELLCRRPDVQRALHEAAAQSARIGIATSDLLPRLSISGFIGFESSADTRSTKTGGGGKLFDSKSLTYFFGPDFAWPLLNYGRLINRVRVEYTRFYQAVLDYQNTVLTAFREAEDGLISFVNAHEEVDELEKSVKAAERSTDLARTQYVEGIADYLRVLDTERSRLEEQERLVIAEGKIALSLIATYRALGGGWEPFACKE